jgi:hypothetical protein
LFVFAAFMPVFVFVTLNDLYLQTTITNI